MILQALKDYYDRKAADPESGIAPLGLELKPIPFLIVINLDGTFIELEDTRDKSHNKGKSYLVPQSKQRSGSKSYATTYLLWDHIGYVMQEPESDSKAINQHATWLEMLRSLPPEIVRDPEVAAILRFYENPDNMAKVRAHTNWSECQKVPISSCNLSFQIAGRGRPVPCSPLVQSHAKTVATTTSGDTGICLITGQQDTIARTHRETRMGKDAKALVSFQKNSGYDSYGKEQAFNAPVGKIAEFAYTTALNTLLKSSQRLRVGDAITVFWSERETPIEHDFPLFFSEPDKDDPDRGAKAVQSLYASIKSGAMPADAYTNRFFVLGLSSNVARISVRFWINDTVAGMSDKICQHFQDIAMVHGQKEPEHLSIWRLLVSTATQGKSDNIPPNLAGETTRSILQGHPYPQTLMLATIRRINAEKKITYPRAAILKACLNRSARFYNKPYNKEITVSLDETNTNIGYRLGRLFATLEKIQQDANPGINATIRDKFYSSASASPVTVFGNLMRLKNHHLAKLENKAWRIAHEKRLGEIMSDITDFPAHLTIENQGRFAIGYYHQMNDFFTSKSNKETNDE